jgi:ubiquitin-conjugating enzyme E2 J2
MSLITCGCFVLPRFELALTSLKQFLFPGAPAASLIAHCSAIWKSPKCLSATYITRTTQQIVNVTLHDQVPQPLNRSYLLAMATPAATKRLTREYAAIQKSPPPFITAHPSDKNILEWHYILTGPPDTPYDGGQYWGTLMFPSDYPFKPPAIRMHTPSGRFQPSTRLCLSISDFHPKSFNPAWEVSTILTGLLSFMTSEEMTTGSVRASEAERKLFAQRTRWWNSTGGGTKHTASSQSGGSHQAGNIRAGDGGTKFRLEWAEVDEENLKWMKEKHIDPATGLPRRPAASTAQQPACSPDVSGLRRRPGTTATVVQDAAQIARDAGQGWMSRNKWKILGGVMMLYILVARVLGDGAVSSSA